MVGMDSVTLEQVSERAWKVNGVLVDWNALRHHLEANSWAGHNPKQKVYWTLGCLINATHDKDYWADTYTQRFLLDMLSWLYNAGFPISKDVFIVCPGKHPYALFRNESSWNRDMKREVYIQYTGHSWVRVEKAIEVWRCTEAV